MNEEEKHKRVRFHSGRQIAGLLFIFHFSVSKLDGKMRAVVRHNAEPMGKIILTHSCGSITNAKHNGEIQD